MLIYPTLNIAADQGIAVADVRAGDVLAQAKPHKISWTITERWLDGRTLRVWYETLSEETRSIDLTLTSGKPLGNVNDDE